MDNSVTICIPVFNARSQIARCLAAALNSFPQGCQILVIDNCSTDGTADIAKEFLMNKAGSRVVINENNIGRIANWNKGLQICETKYLRFALVNDALMKGSTEILLSHASAKKNVVQIFSKENVVNGIGVEIPIMENTDNSLNLNPDATLRRFAGHGCAVACSLNGLLFDTETIKKRGLQFDEKLPFFADYKFNIEVAACGDSVFIPSQSVMVDRSVKGRFFNIGGDGGSLLKEYRAASETLEHLLKGRKLKCGDLYRSQYHLYKTWFLPRGGVRASDCIVAFSSLPYYQFVSIWHLLSSRQCSLSTRIRIRLALRTRLNALLSIASPK